MSADRRRGGERLQIFRVRIDGGGEFADIGEVPQRLDPACGGAGADRHQTAGETTHAQNALGIGRRRDRAFHQREIVRPAHHPPRRLGEIGDVELCGDCEQFVLAVEQAQLAAVARSEFPHREARAGTACHVRSPESRRGERCGRSEKPAHRGRRRRARTGNARTARSRISCCAPSKQRSGPSPDRVGAAHRS